MSDPVTSNEIKEDLLYSNEVAEDYVYEAGGAGYVTIKHLDHEGNPIGTQALSFNIGPYISLVDGQA